MKLSTHYFLRVTAFSALVSCAIGLLVAVFFVSSLNRPAEHVALFVSKIIHETRDDKGLPNLAVLNRLRSGLFLEEVKVSIVDEKLNCLACEYPPEKFGVLPSFGKPYQVQTIPALQNFATRTAAIKLPGEPSYYVFMVLKRPSTAERIVIPYALASTVFLTLLSGFIGAGCILIYTRKRGREAEQVIDALKQGRLHTRFATTKLDEVGTLMGKFNDMAAEMERLVGRLRQAESSRRKLLQELSHDIRTPLAGARAAAATLGTHYYALSEEERTRCATIAKQEVEYTQRMVDDLFLLAELDEPHYRDAFQNIDVIALLSDEYAKRAMLLKQSRADLQLVWRNQVTGTWPVNGVQENLVRLFRNALDNAERFAATKIMICLTVTDAELIIAIQNDGEMATAETLSEFGKQKFPDPEAKTHRGLGSVIMRAIAEQHLGRVDLTNWQSAEGFGVQAVIRFPRASQTKSDLPRKKVA